MYIHDFNLRDSVFSDMTLYLEGFQGDTKSNIIHLGHLNDQIHSD